MINLPQIRSQVKQQPFDPGQKVLNHRNAFGMNEAYRQLKAHGWTSKPELHPADHVPVFRLNGRAAIRRDKTTGNVWIVEVDGEAFDAEGTIADITAHIEEMLTSQPAKKEWPESYRDNPVYQMALAVGDPEPWPEEVEEETRPIPSPAAEIAAELERQHGKLGGRIERALTLVEAGTTEFPHYNTRVDEATGISECDCQDRAPRIDSGNVLGIMTYFNGKACKHCLARNIAYRLQHDQEQVAYRKQADRIERRNQALPASVDNHDRLEDMLGYDDQPKTVAQQKAEARQAVPALKSQQTKGSIGSLPLAWQYR